MLLHYRVRRPRNAYDRGRGLPVEYSFARSLYIGLGKPIVDRVCAALLLILLLPVMLLIAVVLRVSLGRGVLLRQVRIGQGGQPFKLIKFRTMDHCRRTTRLRVAVDRRVCHKTEADPRHTQVGRFLRKWSLDELPELWNVLAGQMSLVGPRPELPLVVAQYADWQHHRHEVKPGLTGLWQVSHRGEGLMHEFTHVDLEYVRRISAGLDLRILATTPAAILKRRGS
jgi:lipopolysaccharide/colanic/teichoic acid biosynthesis glycosyltransferase